MSDSTKRKLDETASTTVKTEDAPRKKRRWDTEEETKSTPTPTTIPTPTTTTPATTTPAPSTTTATTSTTKSSVAIALEKAKQAALLHRQIQEKLAGVGKPLSTTTVKPPPPPPPPPIPVIPPMAPITGFSSRPPPIQHVAKAPEWKPLVLDAQGRAVGETVDVKRVATLMVNQRTVEQREAETAAEKAAAAPEEAPAHDPTKYIDPNISLHASIRAPRAFHFTAPGKHIRKAQAFRAKLLDKQIRIDSLQQQSLAHNQLSVHEIVKPVHMIHTVEWWDQPLVKGEEYDAEINLEKITHYIYHPVELKPAAEKPPPPPPAMKLTLQEKKKIKRMARIAAQKEKEEKIRLGLEKAPENKLSMRNFMAVLGDEAIADPSAAEAKARKQIAERKKQHESNNASRKLTKDQKAEKRRRKYAEDTSVETHVAVFRSGDLSDKQRRFKVDVNVQQWNLKGTALLHPEFHVVVVEGGPKGIKRFINLMLNRINWEKSATNKMDQDETDIANGRTADDMSDDENMMESKRDFGPAKLVWTGVVAHGAFKDFTFTRPRTEALARQYLREKSVEHYWDYCRNYRENQQE